MRLAFAFALLATVAAVSHAASVTHNDNPRNQKEHRVAAEEASAAHNLLRGRHHHRRRRNHRHLQADQVAETKWDNNRISKESPDGLQLNPETGNLDCFDEPCYAHLYDGPVDVGDVNRVVDVPNTGSPNPADEAVEQAALQLALAEAQAATASRARPVHNPNIVYDYSTGHKYDLSTGEKIVIEEVEHTNVSTGQEKVDVKVYVVEEKVPTDHVVPGLGPLDDPTPAQATCAKPLYDETCARDDQCESGCCATLPTKDKTTGARTTVTKCVEPRYPVFNQYCPVRNPCRADPESQGTRVPKEEAGKPGPAQAHAQAQPQPANGIPSGTPQDKESDTGGTMYTVGTFTTSGGNPSTPSNPNRVVDGSGTTTTTGTAQAQSPPPVDCAVAKKDNWPINQFPQEDQCQGSCQCKSGCCVGYGRQICIDKTANEGRWADKCI